MKYVYMGKPALNRNVRQKVKVSLCTSLPHAKLLSPKAVTVANFL